MSKSIGAPFSITRQWELDRIRNPVERIYAEKDGIKIPDSGDIARQFLGLISYRYIPNRSIPSAILREESQEIANSIFLRMRGDKHASALLGELDAAARRMLLGASDSLKTVGSPLTSPNVSIPGTIGEMLTMTGFTADGAHGGKVQDEDWGSGHQAFFLYQVLYALDTNYARFFGWRQATIWGVEEPESALHRDLESQLAHQLVLWSRDPDSRLQILETTHSPTFTMAADAGYWAELVDGASKLSPLPISELTRAAEIRGVSNWVHPVLSFAWNPIILVEGYIDAEALGHAASVAGVNRLRFMPLPRFDNDEQASGKDGLIEYARRYSKLIENRPDDSPLVLLFDWEVSDQDMKKAKAAYGKNAEFYVLRMDSARCEYKMGPDFSGIERFYPSSIVNTANDLGEINVAIPEGKPYSISAAQLKRGKGALLARLKKEISPAALEPLIATIRDIDKSVNEGLKGQKTLPGF